MIKIFQPFNNKLNVTFYLKSSPATGTLSRIFKVHPHSSTQSHTEMYKFVYPSVCVWVSITKMDGRKREKLIHSNCVRVRSRITDWLDGK